MRYEAYFTPFLIFDLTIVYDRFMLLSKGKKLPLLYSRSFSTMSIIARIRFKIAVAKTSFSTVRSLLPLFLKRERGNERLESDTGFSESDSRTH